MMIVLWRAHRVIKTRKLVEKGVTAGGGVLFGDEVRELGEQNGERRGVGLDDTNMSKEIQV